MYRITASLAPTGDTNALPVGTITGMGLQGLLFTLLRDSNPDEATRLHDYNSVRDPETGKPVPAPYTILPLVERGMLIGIETRVFTSDASRAVLTAWETAHNRRTALKLGKLSVAVAGVYYRTAPGFIPLGGLPPASELRFRFLTPVTFSRGAHPFLFPLPESLFTIDSGPVRAWNHFAPVEVRVSEEWLRWLAEDVHVIEYNLCTEQYALDHRRRLVGFVGQATLRASAGSPEEHLRCWHALARVAEFSGFGRKTAIGMGAVQLLSAP